MYSSCIIDLTFFCKASQLIHQRIDLKRQSKVLYLKNRHCAQNFQGRFMPYFAGLFKLTPSKLSFIFFIFLFSPHIYYHPIFFVSQPFRPPEFFYFSKNFQKFSHLLFSQRDNVEQPIPPFYAPLNYQFRPEEISNLIHLFAKD